jgi:hypothetical protein
MCAKRSGRCTPNVRMRSNASSISTRSFSRACGTRTRRETASSDRGRELHLDPRTAGSIVGLIDRARRSLAEQLLKMKRSESVAENSALSASKCAGIGKPSRASSMRGMTRACACSAQLRQLPIKSLRRSAPAHTHGSFVRGPARSPSRGLPPSVCRR